jgi:hypothetical protein
MKQLTAIPIVVLVLGLFTFTQSQAQSDGRAFGIAALVNPHHPLLQDANAELLGQKLEHAISLSGQLALGDEGQFFLVANPQNSRQEFSRGATVQTVVISEVQLKVMDVYSQKSFGNSTITIKGIGENTLSAFRDALRQLKHDDIRLRKLLQQSRVEIARYYEQMCNEALYTAEQLEQKNELVAAYISLQAVPDLPQSCMQDARRKATQLQNKYKQQLCEQQVQKLADAITSGNQLLANQCWHQLMLISACNEEKIRPLANQLQTLNNQFYLQQAQQAFALLKTEQAIEALSKISAAESQNSAATTLRNEIRQYLLDKEAKQYEIKALDHKVAVSQADEKRSALIHILF